MRLARPGMAALLALLAVLGLVIGAGPAQAGSPASPVPVGTTKSITVPLNLQGKDDVTTNATVTGTCGSIFLNLKLASVRETQITYGYKSTQGPVSSHKLNGVYVNIPTRLSGVFGDSGSPNTADFQTSTTVFTGIPSAPAAFLTVAVTTPNGPCIGAVGEALLF
ncbi:hypothetical protein [Amycolatopsis oliviviridis]|uniref:hypothetical protein n=1 Tax=Amycolatopsis oliviviridis TaxID=1471590 RepID=UPI001E48EB13|nr:hypothetical protein [Amycolatopsis oliviviridis]